MAPGSLLSLEVEVSSALTPPPGIQEERAHRAFAISLCAEGTAFHAPARCCFPLAVRNVRPLDGRSLRYRVEAPVPLWVAPSRYDLRVRFPGGEAQLVDAVLVGSSERDVARATRLGTPDGFTLQAGGEPARARLHVGAGGLDLRAARFDVYPLPGAQGLRHGFVALVDLAPGQRLALRLPPAGQPPSPAIVSARGAMAETLLLSTAPQPGARHFWWLGPDQGAFGARVQARFAMRGSARVQLLAIDADGRVARTERLVKLGAPQTEGCAARPPNDPEGRQGLPWLAAGLLVVTRSRKLGGRARRLLRAGDGPP